MESVHFPLKELHTSKQVFYEDVRQRIFPGPLDRRSPTQLLYRISDFANRDLTYDSDAINAMEGIFSLFKSMSPSVDHLCGLPIFSSSSFRGSVSATTRLAAALAWNTTPGFSRRQVFPSWTWTGWKRVRRTEQGKLSVYFPIYQRILEEKSSEVLYTPIQITAEFESGVKFARLREVQDLLDMSYTGDKLSYLHIRAWTFTIQVARKNVTWQILAQFHGHFLADLNDEELWLGHEDTGNDAIHNLTGLVLISHGFDLGFLVLRPGTKPNTFERLGFRSTPHMGEDRSRLWALSPQLNDRIRIGDVDLEYKDICLA